MARIFISYSRADTNFVEQFLPLAKRLFPEHEFFYDDHITGGEDWWQRILAEIAKADLFIYLLSNDSLESEYCQAEFREAQRLHKAILPVIVRRLQLQRAPDDIQSEIRRLNWVDMQKGFKDADAYTRLQSSIRQHLLNVSASADAPPPISPKPVSEPVVRDKKNSQITAAYIAGGFLLVSVVIAGIFGLWQGVFANSQSNTPTPSDDERDAVFTQVVQDATSTALANLSDEEIRETAAAGAFATLTANAPTDTPTITPTPSNTPISQSDVQRTIQAEIFATATSTQLTAEAIANQTQRAEQTQAFVAGLTATRSFNLSQTPPATDTPITPTATSTNIPEPPTATLIPDMPEPEQVALEGVTSNAEWEALVGEGGYVREFDGIEMVLVPAGEFEMGSENGDSYETPVHTQRITEPFWIDRYEVTNEQYGSTGCERWSSELDQPRNCVDWFEALAHCQARGTTLPTEAQWEYVARGPNSLNYPWGNNYVAENVIGEDDPTYGDTETAPVGSRPGGASWVGALDMSGNVWEWTLSEYMNYPYDTEDGRNDNLESTDVRRVLRGGSFLDTSDGLRSANRLSWVPDESDAFLGFRCARSYQ